MVNPIAIGNFAVSCGTELKKFVGKIKNDPFSLEIKKLKEQREKFAKAMDLVGRDYYRVGEDSDEFKRNALNCLAVVEHVSLPYPEGVYPLKKAGYYFINPERIREPSSDIELKTEIIYPQPKEAASFIESAVAECSDAQGFGYLANFAERKDNLINSFVRLGRRIKRSRNPKKDYTPIREELVENVREMYRLDKEYKGAIEMLETKSDIKKVKIGAAALVGIVTGAVVGAKLKKAKALKTLAHTLK
jgi:hypothetical protein